MDKVRTATAQGRPARAYFVRIAVAATVDDAGVSHNGDAQAGELVFGMFCKSYWHERDDRGHRKARHAS